MVESKRFNSRNQFKKWITKCSSIVLVGITLSQGAIKINSNWQQTTQIIRSIKATDLPQAKYQVSFERKSDNDEPSFVRTIHAIAYNHDRFGINQISELKEIIKEKNYCVIEKRNSKLVTFVIAQPESPLELDELVAKLRRSGVFNTLDLGTGYMEELYIHGKKIG